MRKIRILLFLSVIYLLCSCINDIEFNGEQQESKLVMNSFLTPDSAVKVHITRSKFFLEDDTKFDAITNADVKLFVNGSFVEKLSHIQNGYYAGNYFPKEHDVIKLVASAPQLEEVNASTTIIPNQLIIGVDSTTLSLGATPIIEYKYSPTTHITSLDTIGYNYNKGLDLRIRFKDKPNEKNFYRILVTQKSYFENGKFMTGGAITRLDDMVFGNNNTDFTGEGSFNSVYNEFNDQLFDGDSYELKIRVLYFCGKLFENKIKTNTSTIETTKFTKKEIVVHLQSISESYYRFLKSLSVYNNANDFLSEPVQIYSNIENGMGILVNYTQSTKAIEIPANASFNLDPSYSGVLLY